MFTRKSAWADKLLFGGQPDPPVYNSLTFGADFIAIPRNAGSCIPALLFKSVRESPYLFVYVHGKGCDLGAIHHELRTYQAELGMHVLAFDYSGHGICKGVASETTIDHDIGCVFNFITETLNVPANRVILCGRSLGTGPCTQLSAHLQLKRDTTVGALVLLSPYTSLADVVEHLVGQTGGSFMGTMASRILSDRWVTRSNLPHVQSPVCIIHGKQDTVIPCSHSEHLATICKAPKRVHLHALADHSFPNFASDVISPLRHFFGDILPHATALTITVPQEHRSAPPELFHCDSAALVQHVAHKCTTRLPAFCIRYRAAYGQHLRVVGSLPVLGEWNVHNAPVMSWQVGDYWVMNLKPQSKPFEYKYIVVDGNGQVERMEEGENHFCDHRVCQPVMDFWHEGP